MVTYDDLGKFLGRIFDGAMEGAEGIKADEYAQRRRDFVFHMTDVKSDLEKLTKLFNDPNHKDQNAAVTLVIGFLYHVTPHLNAAGKLLLDEIPDHFSGTVHKK